MIAADFGTYDPPLARAVVAVLRDEGLRAWVEDEDGSGGRVLVVPVDQPAAVSALARRMEDVRELAAAEATADRPHPPSDRPAPLVMERFRSAGALVAVLLAPLLVVTLSWVGLTPGLVAAVVVVAALAIVVVRRRS